MEIGEGDKGHEACMPSQHCRSLSWTGRRRSGGRPRVRMMGALSDREVGCGFRCRRSRRRREGKDRAEGTPEGSGSSEAACKRDLSLTQVGRPRLGAEREDMGGDTVVRRSYRNRLVTRFH